MDKNQYNQLIGHDEMSFDKGSHVLDDPSQLSMGFFDVNMQSSHKKLSPFVQSPSDIDLASSQYQ